MVGVLPWELLFLDPNFLGREKGSHPETQARLMLEQFGVVSFK